MFNYLPICVSQIFDDFTNLLLTLLTKEIGVCQSIKIRVFCYFWIMLTVCQGSNLFAKWLQNTRLLTVSISQVTNQIYKLQGFIKSDLGSFEGRGFVNRVRRLRTEVGHDKVRDLSRPPEIGVKFEHWRRIRLLSFQHHRFRLTIVDPLRFNLTGTVFEGPIGSARARLKTRSG